MSGPGRCYAVRCSDWRWFSAEKYAWRSERENEVLIRVEERLCTYVDDDLEELTAFPSESSESAPSRREERSGCRPTQGFHWYIPSMEVHRTYRSSWIYRVLGITITITSHHLLTALRTMRKVGNSLLPITTKRMKPKSPPLVLLPQASKHPASGIH